MFEIHFHGNINIYFHSANTDGMDPSSVVTRANPVILQEISFTKMLHEHIKTIVPQVHGPECTMRFLSASRACIAGSAGVKSIARFAMDSNDESVYDRDLLSSETVKGMIYKDSDVDFWVPCPSSEITSDPISFVKSEILRCFDKAFVGKPDISVIEVRRNGPEYRRLHKHVSTIFTVTCPEATGTWTQLQFMLLRENVTAVDAVRAFDIKALQVALGFQFRRSITDHASFVRACDVTLTQDVMTDLREMQITISKDAYDIMSISEWFRTLYRIVKYVRNYGWTITDNELLSVQQAVHKRLTIETQFAHWLRNQWNEYCLLYPDILTPLMI